MLLIGHKHGWQAFLGLVINFVLLFIGIALMAFQIPPVIVLIVVGTSILAVTIFTGNDDLAVTTTSFWSSLIVLVILSGLIVLVNYHAMIQGFSNEQSDEVAGFSVQIGISFLQIATVSMIFSSLGAIAEASIAVATGLEEVLEHQQLSTTQFLLSGFHIGQQIIGTTLNTLFFGLFGSSLALFIWFSQLNYSLEQIINNQILGQALIELLMSFLGVLLIVPVTTLVLKHRQLDKQNQQ